MTTVELAVLLMRLEKIGWSKALLLAAERRKGKR